MKAKTNTLFSMNVIHALTLVVVVLLVYLALIEIYVTLFRITGLTREKARFQVTSMITAVGFTTAESELIATDPKRRRIAIACMLTSAVFNVVIIGLLINVVNSWNLDDIKDSYWILLIVLAIATFLIVFFLIPPVNNFFSKIISVLAAKFFNIGSVNSNSITQIDSYGNNAILQIKVNVVPDALKDKTLAEADLKAKYGLNLMMIKRGARVIECDKDTIVSPGDFLFVFGSKGVTKELFNVHVTKNGKKVKIHNENYISLIDNYGQDAMAEIEVHVVPEILKDKKLIESDLRKKYFISVLKIKRHHGSATVDKDAIITKGDTILVLGPYKNIKSVFGVKE